MVDGAGERTSDHRKGDAWGIILAGVEPEMDDLGASNVYILDAVIKPMPLSDAITEVVNMYLRGGRILKMGVEKTGLTTTEVHIAGALRARGKFLSVERGNLVILKPGGRKKEERIEHNLQWPLVNSKLHVSKAVPVEYRERLRKEMDQFPFWHEDGIDALSYLYDILIEYAFNKKALLVAGEEKPRDAWAEAFSEDEETVAGWLSV